MNKRWWEGTEWDVGMRKPAENTRLLSRGYYHYWTEAERAGLKAIGREYVGFRDHSVADSAEWEIPIMYAIRDFVRAARKVKDAR